MGVVFTKLRLYSSKNTRKITLASYRSGTGCPDNSAALQ